MRLVTTLAIGLALIGLGVGGATLAASPDDIIAARQAGYKHIGDIDDAMKKVVNSGGGDVKPFASQATEIAAWGRKLVTLFPPGTETGHDTKARPEIWTDRAGFEAAAASLVTEADKLSAVAATGDFPAFAAQWKAMGGACGTCHRNYRYRS